MPTYSARLIGCIKFEIHGGKKKSIYLQLRVDGKFDKHPAPVSSNIDFRYPFGQVLEKPHEEDGLQRIQSF